MKKRMFSILIVAFTFIACNQTDLNNKVEEKGVLLSSKTLVELSSFNENLLKNKDHSMVVERGWWGDFKKGLIVAGADIIGAGTAVWATKEIAVVVGIASGGTGGAVVVGIAGAIGGAGASIMAYDAVPSAVYVEQEPSAIRIEFVDPQAEDYVGLYTHRDEDGENVTVGGENSYEYNYIIDRLNIPAEFLYLTRVGEDHNKIIKLAYTKGLSETVLRSYIPDEEEEVISVPSVSAEVAEMVHKLVYSAEFKESQQAINKSTQIAYSSGSFDAELFFKEFPLGSKKVEEAIKLYLSLYMDFPDDLDDIVLISNQYIDIIEKNNEFSYDEKQAIYSALIVSLYSPQIWM